MRYVRTNNLGDNMTLARPIFGEDGRILLNAGVVINSTYKEKLAAIGIPGVYVSIDEHDDFQGLEVISQQTRQPAIKQIKDVFESVQVGKTFDVVEIMGAVNSIIDEVMANPNVVANLAEIRSYDGYTFAHSVNVCVLSIILGMKFELNELQLKELALGAILHDIGKTKVDNYILCKPGALTKEEREEVQKHTLYGWQILRNYQEIPLQSAHIAYQHHERPNGQGYPRQLIDEQMTLYAQIVGTVDAYDAMTSERVYRPAMTPAEALRLIKRLRGIQFNAQVIDYFIEIMVPYPVGSLVLLDSKEVGLVVDVNKAMKERPVVRLIYHANGKKYEKLQEIDLATNQDLYIIRGLQ